MMFTKTLSAIFFLLLSLNVYAQGFRDSSNQNFTFPGQAKTLLNSETTGAADTAVTATLAGATGERVHLRAIDARCSAGTASVTVDDGATTIWSSAADEVGTTRFRETWPVALTGDTGNTMTVTLSTCGAGNTGTLTVQADRS